MSAYHNADVPCEATGVSNHSIYSLHMAGADRVLVRRGRRLLGCEIVAPYSIRLAGIEPYVVTVSADSHYIRDVTLRTLNKSSTRERNEHLSTRPVARHCALDARNQDGTTESLHRQEF